MTIHLLVDSKSDSLWGKGIVQHNLVSFDIAEADRVVLGIHTEEGGGLDGGLGGLQGPASVSHLDEGGQLAGAGLHSDVVVSRALQHETTVEKIVLGLRFQVGLTQILHETLKSIQALNLIVGRGAA